MSFLILPIKLSIFLIENLNFKWQSSQYLELNPTCANVEVETPLIQKHL